MLAYMACRDFSVNGGMLARNGVVQGLPADRGSKSKRGKGSNRPTLPGVGR